MAHGFNKLDSDDTLGLLRFIADDLGIDSDSALSLSHYIAENILGGEVYESEQALSAAFDACIAPLVIEQYGADDIPAMNQAFNDWTDCECREGRLSFAQYHEYCYVGSYDDD